MVKRNRHFKELKDQYLFPEIFQRKEDFQKKHPDAHIISLGVGDTTEPIPPSIAHALGQASARLGTPSGYTGYGPEQGQKKLREKIAHHIYLDNVSPEDIFISDGSKCDIGRLQLLFGEDLSVAIQDPCYPVYLDGSLLRGVKHIHMMPCSPENQFFPDLSGLPKVDLIYFCSPNNPTGAVATRQQLETLVALCQQNGSILLFDGAYAHYIQDPYFPKSIFDIPGAEEVAIEIGSFSKIAGFTGVRLGWTVVPETLRYEEGGSIKADWKRLMTTLFNGASNIAQAGGIAVLEKTGWKEIQALTQFYMENAALLRETLQNLGYRVFGGMHSPYLWVHFPGRTSWEVFQKLLEKYHIVTTPGSGFGPHGEGFIRFSAFCHRSALLEAIDRMKASGI